MGEKCEIKKLEGWRSDGCLVAWAEKTEFNN